MRNRHRPTKSEPVAAAHGGKFDSQQGGGEYALTLAVVLAGLVFTGPGRFTIPALFGAGGASRRIQEASA